MVDKKLSEVKKDAQVEPDANALLKDVLTAYNDAKAAEKVRDDAAQKLSEASEAHKQAVAKLTALQESLNVILGKATDPRVRISA